MAALSFAVALGAVLGDGKMRGAARRGTATISLVAVERLLQFSLLLAAGFPFLRWASAHPAAPPLYAALALSASIAPTLPLWLLLVPAFSMAIARAASGERTGWRWPTG